MEVLRILAGEGIRNKLVYIGIEHQQANQIGRSQDNGRRAVGLPPDPRQNSGSNHNNDNVSCHFSEISGTVQRRAAVK